MSSVLDTTYEVETPEAIDLNAYIVGPVPRVLAYTIDLSIRVGVLLILAIILAFMDEAGWGIFMVFSFLMEWFYPVLFEVLRRGQTPGKKVLQIAVVNDDLTPISWSGSIVRNLLRAVDILPFAYVAGIISVTCSQHFQRLGDFAAGSLVVYRKKALQATSLPEVSPVPPPQNLTVENQLAMASFTRRHDQISPARQEELANLLEPVTGKQGADAVRHVHGVGLWLLGEKREAE